VKRLVLAVLLTGSAVSAEAATTALQLENIVTIVPAMGLTILNAPGTPSGLGTNAASTSLGTLSSTGPAPSGMTLTQNATNWQLSGYIVLDVQFANGTSSFYSLTAHLAQAPPTNVTWSLDYIPLTTSPKTILSSVFYGSASPYWQITVANSVSSATLSNTIIFTAISE
jgi:hypothetical protein